MPSKLWSVVKEEDDDDDDLLNEGFRHYSIINDDKISGSILSILEEIHVVIHKYINTYSQSLDELIVTSLFLNLAATWLLYPDSCYSDQSCV